MPSPLIDTLLNLSPAGRSGFEGLVAQLMARLTGRVFHLARSGYQAGHDMVSGTGSGTVIAVECKRYGQTTELDQRELLGELEQADQGIPDLDVWVLASSQKADSLLLTRLVEAARKRGIEIVALCADDSEPSSLDVLCAQGSDLVMGMLAGHIATDQQAELEAELLGITKSPGYAPTLRRLRDELASENIGYDHWRAAQNTRFVRNCSSEALSFKAFGQLLNVDDTQVNFIERQSVWRDLDSWCEGWGTSPSWFVLLGEEGDGKTWALAAWLSRRIKALSNSPPVVMLCSEDVVWNDPSALLVHHLAGNSSLTDKDFWEKRLDRWLRRAPNGNPLLLLVLDGINERRRPDWWRTLLERNLAAEPWHGRAAVIITCRAGYWEQHFKPSPRIPTKTFVLAPYSDSELNEALQVHHLNRSEIPANVLPLMRKPRYFDLVVRHRQRMAESGDITIARLMYEDWRDRYGRKTAIPLDDISFQNVLMALAQKHREGASKLSWADIRELLPGTADPENVFLEVSTGGVLRPQGAYYRVEERPLVQGLGLLLAEETRLAWDAGDVDVPEAVARWLEPHADMDIKADICGAAVLHALD